VRLPKILIVQSPGFDIAVRGAGVVGACAALALAHDGHSVAWVCDDAPLPKSGDRAAAAGPTQPADAPPAQDVRAFALNAASAALLRRLKVWQALPDAACTPVQDMLVHGDAQPGRLHFSAWQQGSEALAWIVDAQALEAALHEALRYAPQVQRLARNAQPRAELLVVTEGRDSATRTALGAHMALDAYGHSAIAARLLCAQPHAGAARQWFAAPSVLALLPAGLPEPGRSYALVWSMPTAQAKELMALPEVEFMRALHSALGEQALAVGELGLASPRGEWPLALGQARPLCGPGWVLAGDAAHVVHPLAGQGLNLGLGDVEALRRVLAQREGFRRLGDEKLLRRYARERQLPVQAMRLATDGLWQLFSHSHPVLRGLRNEGMAAVDRLAPLKRWLVQRAMGR
jgi:ubiquinone biosynthesis UbiH/UbiF/VisC/COQ6 family hydroxylase